MIGDKVEEGRADENLVIAYRCLGEIKQAIKYHELELSIAKMLATKLVRNAPRAILVSRLVVFES